MLSSSTFVKVGSLASGHYIPGPAMVTFTVLMEAKGHYHPSLVIPVLSLLTETFLQL